MRTVGRSRFVRLIGIVVAGGLAVTAAGAAAPPGAASAGAPTPPAKSPLAIGSGGAVSSVDPDATRIGLDVLRRGGNAVDAAVATAAALGVTEPYSAGVGGGGFFAYYDAATKRVLTIDGRETAPAAFGEKVFVENGVAIPFAEAVTSGLSVGVPGTPMTWQAALDRWGTRSLRQSLAPAAELARKGFVVDPTFRQQTADNEARFRDFPATSRLFLPGGQLPVVGTAFRNPDLARTYDELGRRGVDALYTGPIGRDLVRTAQAPPVDPKATRKVRPGLVTTADLRAYYAPFRAPTKVSYRGLDVYGMAPPSSGGSTVGEALNILERSDLAGASQTQYLHRFLESTKLSFADRNRYVGDPDFVDVPLQQLLSDGFAGERACLINPARALPAPQPPGSPDGSYGPCPAAAPGIADDGHEGLSTTHLTAADRWGNVVAYTLTIESTGGSAITVPGRGFLLNNELTDFNFTPVTAGVPDPNLPGPGKRPRSSMSPTIVLKNGKPMLALGSPGGATIITTVLQTLLGRLERGLRLDAAIAAPRASQRNGVNTDAEPALIASPAGAELAALGHRFASVAEIGAATAIELLANGRFLAAAETVRRGGGAAGVAAAGLIAGAGPLSWGRARPVDSAEGAVGGRRRINGVTIDRPLRFAKGHGTENDFVVLPDPEGELALDAALVSALCDRRAGLGADGVLRVVRVAADPEAVRLVAALPAGAAPEWFMDYRNADGSIVEMCGNGVRVFGRYLVRAGLAEPGVLPIATRAGVKTVTVPAEGDVVVDMGAPVFTGESVATLAGRPYPGVGVSMGNPHLVCTTASPLAGFDLTVAPGVDVATFPTGVNVELVNGVPGPPPDGADLHVTMRVHERGVGETRSCGTGASAVGAVALRAAGRETGTVAVDVPGGRVLVTVTGETSLLAGPAVIVAEGTLDPAWLAAASPGARVPSSVGAPA